MKPIPISAAKDIAKKYGYDQIIILGRVCHDSPLPHGDHLTTYGKNPEHCGAAAQIGDFLKFKVMGWIEETKH
jgi:hypothetical protein